MLGLIVTAYKLPDALIDRFVESNLPALAACGGRLYLVTDARKYLGENIRALPCPEMEVFAIGRTANIGIRSALADGCAIICKTDIDCILDEAALADIDSVRPGCGTAYRYWHIPAPDQRENPRMDGRIMGTIALTATDWQSVGLYDERMDGYGYDDWDIVDRARRRGIKCQLKNSPRIYHIWHEVKHNRNTINPMRREQNVKLSRTTPAA